MEGGAVLNHARFLLQVSKGLVRDLRARRLVMFYSVLVALVLLFAGATVLWSRLREHPFVFIGYWFVCGWITILAALLAIYDLLRVRAEARQLRRKLHSDYLHEDEDDDDAHDADAR